MLVLHVVRSTSPEIKVLKKPILVVSLLKAPGGYEQAKRMSGHSETPSVLWPGVPRPSRMPLMDVAELARGHTPPPSALLPVRPVQFGALLRFGLKKTDIVQLPLTFYFSRSKMWALAPFSGEFNFPCLLANSILSFT